MWLASSTFRSGMVPISPEICHNYDNWNEIKSTGTVWIPLALWQPDARTALPARRLGSLMSTVHPTTTATQLELCPPHKWWYGVLRPHVLREYELAAEPTASATRTSPWHGARHRLELPFTNMGRQNLRTEVGYNANPRTPVSCQTLSAGNHRIDFVHRFQGFLNGNSFAAHPRWCQASPGGTCTPNREFGRHLMTPVSSL